MSDNAEKALALFQARIGEEDAPGQWHRIDQAQIDRFADATLDHQFIHVDPHKAKETPFGTTIAHGFLTLSLLPHLQSSIPPADPKAYQGVVMGINYGLDKVRFPTPVKVDAHVRARRELVSAERKAPSTIQLKQKVTVDIEGEDKPGCVAEFLTRLVYA